MHISPKIFSILNCRETTPSVKEMGQQWYLCGFSSSEGFRETPLLWGQQSCPVPATLSRDGSLPQSEPLRLRSYSQATS